jgi:hypothetical protein
MANTLELKEVLTHLQGLERDIQVKLREHGENSRKLAGATLHTGKQLSSLEDKHADLEVELKGIVNDLASRFEEVDAYVGLLKKGMTRPGGSIEDDSHGSLGQMFVGSEEFKSFAATGKVGRDGAPTPPPGNMQYPVEIKGGLSRMVGMGRMGGGANAMPQMLRKDILSGDSNLRDIFAVDKIQQIFYNPLRPNRIRDLFAVIPTTANSVEFVTETLYDIQADMVADGAASNTSNFRFDDETQGVKTLSHWTPINRNLLSDVPALAAYIDLRLLEGLKEVEDRQLLYGDGTGQNLQGMMVTPGVQIFNQGDGSVNDTIIDTLRRAMTRAQLAYFAISAYVLNPLDWEEAELTKSTIRDYVWVNVGTGADPILWKVPVICTTAMNHGEYLTGSFNMNAAVWDREQANMRVTDSHSNLWVLNQLAVGVWERLALTVFRPPAFVRGAFNGAPLS